MEYSSYPYYIYILNLSGVPIFAGSTSKEYSVKTQEDLLLHSSFYSSIYQYSLNGIRSSLKTIIFDDAQVNFKIDELLNFMVVMVHPSHVDPYDVYTHLNKTHLIFIQNYSHLIDEGEDNNTIFNEFKEKLQLENIIPDDLFSILEGIDKNL